MPLADFTPSVEDVGGIMRARTRDRDGEELGTFTDSTRPSGEEVEGLIAQLAPLVAARLGDVPESLYGAAKTVVQLRVAMLVETSYFPEEGNGEDSAYARYREQYMDAMADYTAAAEGESSGSVNTVGSIRVGTIFTRPDLYPQG